MLQEEDSFLKDFSSYWLKHFLKKKNRQCMENLLQTKRKFKDRYSHSHYEASIPTTPKMQYQLSQISRQSKEQFKH